MRNIFLTIAVFLLNNYAKADCGPNPILSCTAADVFIFESIKSIENPLKIDGDLYNVDAKYQVTMKNVRTGNKETFLSKFKISNKKEVHVAYKQVACGDKNRSHNESKINIVKDLMFVYISVWPSNNLCASSSEELFVLRPDQLSDNDLSKNKFFLLKKLSNKEYIYFAYPNFFIHVDASNNMCRSKVCDRNKKMKVTKMFRHGAVSFDDNNRLIHPNLNEGFVPAK
jgi:hypothetical protein